MPQLPLKPCAYPGCPKTIREGRYCPAHKTIAGREFNRYQRAPDHNKRFGHRWRKIRNLYISKHPLCELCEKEGRLVPAYAVHHLKAWADGGNDEDDNLQALCASCHSRVSLSETKEKYPGGF